MKTLKRLAGALWSLVCWMTPHITTEVYAMRPLPGKTLLGDMEDDWDNFEMMGLRRLSRPWHFPTHTVEVRGLSWFDYMFFCRRAGDIEPIPLLATEVFEKPIGYRLERFWWCIRYSIHMCNKAGWKVSNMKDLRFCMDSAGSDWLACEEMRVKPGCPKQAADDEMTYWP